MEYKLKEVLDYIHNYFVMDTYEGNIVIKNHKIDNSKIDLYNNQYYMIKGSLYNDGIWKYQDYDENDIIDESKPNPSPEEQLEDENFFGEILLLRIPKDVLKIVNEIIEWENKNKDSINGIYQSESFGGYSYSLKNGTSKDGNATNISWKDYFGDKLKCYRKIG